MQWLRNHLWGARPEATVPEPPAGHEPERYTEAELAKEPNAIPLRPIYPTRLNGSAFEEALSAHPAVRAGGDILTVNAALGFLLSASFPGWEAMERPAFVRIQFVALDLVVGLLDRNRQRATYGAVAAFVGLPVGRAMAGRPKDRLNSWVVSKGMGLPLGYAEEDLHPALLDRPVIERMGELRDWLAEAR